METTNKELTDKVDEFEKNVRTLAQENRDLKENTNIFAKKFDRTSADLKDIKNLMVHIRTC